MVEKTLKELFVEMITNYGVYGKLKIENYEEGLQLLRDAPKSLDLFCPQCKAEKTLVYKTSWSNSVLGYYNYRAGSNIDKLNGLIYNCPTCKLHIAYIFDLGNDNIIKIGQYPSQYDLSRDELKRYQKYSLLSKEEFDEIYKAEICASESYFVAAYLYMRRIYETLLQSVFELHKDEINITKDNFEKLHSDEKIKNLKDYLGIEEDIYKPLYSLLSEGLHSLSEEECAENYTLLKEILLDILSAQKENAEKIKRRKQILKLSSARKNKKQ